MWAFCLGFHCRCSRRPPGSGSPGSRPRRPGLLLPQRPLPGSWLLITMGQCVMTHQFVPFCPISVPHALTSSHPNSKDAIGVTLFLSVLWLLAGIPPPREPLLTVHLHLQNDGICVRCFWPLAQMGAIISCTQSGVVAIYLEA